MKILAYSDIHYHNYNNGITLEDVAAAELAIVDLVKRHSIDMVIFCGDRFVSRNPHYDVLLAATKTLDIVLKGIGDVPFLYLVGNHDQTVKNSSGTNTAEHLLLSEYSNLHLLDCRGDTHYIQGTTGGAYIYAVPAGTENASALHEPLNGITICLYHGMIKNAKYDTDLVSTDGHDCSFLDSKDFDLVICGDNHRHQKLDMFQNTPAWYVGATLQHKWSETNTKRGYMIFDIKKQGSVAEIKAEHIESAAPKFVILNVSANVDIYQYLLSQKDAIIGNVVRLIVTGTGTQIAAIELPPIKEYIFKIGAKSASVKPDYIFEAAAASKAEVVSDVGLWKSLVNSLPENTDLDPNQIFELGKGYLND